MGKAVTAVTIGKLIEAHNTGDTEKFKRYAQYIVDAYQEAGNTLSVGLGADWLCNVKTALTIDKLIEAHNTGDTESFNSYVRVLIDVYREAGKASSADIIRKYKNGTYKNESKVVLD